MTEDKITEISCIADDSCKVFFLEVKLGVKEVKEVREVKEVKAICFENTGVKNSEVKPLPLLIIARQHCANQFIMRSALPLALQEL